MEVDHLSFASGSMIDEEDCSLSLDSVGIIIGNNLFHKQRHANIL